MYKNFKKLLPAACAACALTTSVFANSNYNGSNSHSDDSMDGRHRSMMGLPDASPRVTNGADVFLGVDFILWTAQGYRGTPDGSYAIKDGVSAVQHTATGTENANKGSLEFFDTQFDPGFKALFGLNLQHDGDDTLLRYTWFYTSNSASTSQERDVFARTESKAFGRPVDTADGHPLVIVFDQVRAESSLHFNNFDWEFGRGFYTSPYMTLRFHIGLKGGWGDREETTTRSGTDLLDYSQDEGRSINCYDPIVTSLKTDYWWIGIRGGFMPTFYFSKNWSMFGNFALSTLWTGTQPTYREKIDICLNSLNASAEREGRTVVNAEGTAHSVGHVLEADLGFRFDYWWDDDNYHMALSASWENQVWNNVGPSNWYQGLRLAILFSF